MEKKKRGQRLRLTGAAIPDSRAINVLLAAQQLSRVFGRKYSTLSPSGGGSHELRRIDTPGVRPGDGEHAEGAGARSRGQAGLASPSQVSHDRLERQPPRRDSGLG